MHAHISSSLPAMCKPLSVHMYRTIQSHTMQEHKLTEMGLAVLFFCSLFAFSNAAVSARMGINYGRLGNNIPSPFQSIELIQAMRAHRVKIYDADSEILKLLSGTKLEVAIMVKNDQISDVATNQTLADQWVRDNVLSYYPDTMIRFILVGNEVLSYNSSDADKRRWADLVPAMERIETSIETHGIHNIKVGTPLAMDIMEATFPPSNGAFRSDLSQRVIAPLLRFLDRTNSFFFLDVYPYFPWSADPINIDLDFALLKGVNQTYVDKGSGLAYTNLLDQMLDSVLFAMTKLGYNSIKLAISETGWPNAGDLDQPGANIYNAATYNRHVVQKMTAKPPLGTPACPGVVIPTFIFSLYDENQKDGPGTERHWGVVHPDGRPMYQLDLTGKRSMSDYLSVPEPDSNEAYSGKIWCVMASGVNWGEVESMLSYVCGQGNGTCDALAPGKDCYEPVSLGAHASYAFSSYWAEFRSSGVACHFRGLAVQTTRDPSHGSCKFPSVSVGR